jgi:hypothetical protein
MTNEGDVAGFAAAFTLEVFIEQEAAIAYDCESAFAERALHNRGISKCGCHDRGVGRVSDAR